MENKIAEPGRYLSFYVDDEAFAIPVCKVEVVLETPIIRRVPNAEPYMRGVINYRGSVVPVIDPKLRFGGNAISLDASPSVIILQFCYDGEDVVAGMLATGVREVVDITEDDIEPAPRMGSRLGKGFLSGVARLGNEFVVLLDVETAFAVNSTGV